jgi:DNA uptake protein ComE-like DNA-binding protein
MPSLSSQKGFILAATLWILAILTLAAGFFSLWTQQIVAMAQARQTELQGQMDMYSTQAGVFYLLASQRFTIGGVTLPEEQPRLDSESTPLTTMKPRKFAGFEGFSILPVGGELGLDDRAYFGHGKAYFALQDSGGLIHLNYPSGAILNRLLGLMGVTPELRDPLIAKLVDYIDIDNLHQLNGAEAYHYQKRNLPPPTNHPLISPLEVQRVLDWNEQLTVSQLQLFGQMTTTSGLRYVLYPNINTAPSMVLQSVYGLDHETAERVIQARQITPFSSPTMATTTTGIVIAADEENTIIFPQPILRLTLWYEGSSRMRQISFRLTADADGQKPWQIEYHLDLKLLDLYAKATPHFTQTTLFTPASPPP